MSIIDNELVLAEAQSLVGTDTSASTATKDLGNALLEAKTAYLRAKITVAGAGAGSVQLVAVVDGVEISAGIVTLATDLAVGDVLKVPIPPNSGGALGATVKMTGIVSAGEAFIDVEVG